MAENRTGTVDVAINAYGKPYQTAVTILTLLKHSGEWINKIYFIEEKKQPEPSNFQFLFDHLGDKIVHYRPKIWLWTNKLRFNFLMNFKKYRYALRYQYAWEKSDREYLLIMHNDVYFKDDLVGAYLENIGNASGIGRIGQCWVCPAFAANLCNPEKYTEYKPSYKELMELADKYPQPRTKEYARVMDKNVPWPLPECRLNEYVALVNLSRTKPDTVPVGKAIPFGAINRIDTGVQWFSDISNLGHTFRHFDYDPYATHSWISLKNAGHAALFNQDLYKYEESVAKEVLKKEFGI
ncbi:hypothetical protein DYBT9275_02448 [Dyadobacter sp. CECT 9275]|uniref:Uncharacterized protein n=1 Tax=Dyadobacter helix TaxID=2822344 RepID=A0A916NC90_9BACT|nr:hypothetical protein [Dyadobacter sp. CECT 9275]CAG5000365.1 hypothetical protein DYBT9275_02448 [Dyadobacter sp. CECT 9275]